MFRDLSAVDRALVIVALREYAERCDQQAAQHTEPVFATVEREAAEQVRSIIRRAKGE